MPPIISADAYPEAADPGAGESRRHGQRQLRLELRRELRREQNRRFVSFLKRASFGTLVPGLGMIISGRRVLGWTMLVAFLAALGAIAYLALTTPRAQLVGLAVNPRILLLGSVALGLVALSLLLSSAASHHVLQPAGIRRSQRVVGATVVTLLTSLVVAPVALASRYAWVQHDLVSNVFTAAPPPVAPGETPEPAPPAIDPWAGVERVNVLLIGSDAGPGRDGTRPDTNVVASVDPATGDAVLFSLPRNLENAPFPPGSELAQLYPFGWQGDPNDPGSELFNAIYRFVPAAHPELFEDVDDPGAAAMMLAAEGVTGLPIDYYVMVDLDGFQQVVDALGGIDINVRYRIPLESSMLPSGICSAPTYYLEPGVQRLNGYEALWYARVRCGGPELTDDFERMRRQRCVIGAMVDRGDPLTLLRRYESLAGTAKRIVSTDISSDRVPAFAELGLRVQAASIRSLPFTDVVINPGNPDFAAIQAEVQKALEPPAPKKGKGSGGAGGAGAGGAGTGGAGTGATPSPVPDESQGAQDLDEVC
jgi:LCP family protein required for cell wall assembly